MKVKHLIIVCLLLAIITMGAASASEDTASDGLAASNDDNVIVESVDGGDDGGNDENNAGGNDVIGDDDEEEESPVEFYVDDSDSWNVTDDDDLTEYAFITVSADEAYRGTVTITCDDSYEVYSEQVDWDGSDEDGYTFEIFLDNITDKNTFFYNAEKFTIAFNGQGISESQTFLIHHDENHNELITFEEEGTEPETEPSVEFYVDEDGTWDVNNEYDLTQNPFISILADEAYSGTVTIICDDSYEVYNRNVQLQYPDVDDYGLDIFLDNLTDKNRFFHNAKMFTIEFDGQEVSESQTFLIIHDEDNDNILKFKEYDDSETLLPDFDVIASNNFDVNNPNATVITVRWEDKLAGTVWIEISDLDEMRERVQRPLIEDEREFNMTVSELEINGKDGRYWLGIYYYEDDDEEPDWDDDEELDEHNVDELTVEGRDYNNCWADIHHNVNFFSSEAVITFFCGNKSQGIVNVTVYKYLDFNGDVMEIDGYYHKDIANNEEGYLYWTLADLQLEPDVGHLLVVSIDDWQDSGECFVTNPVQYAEMAYLDSAEDDHVGFVFIEIPDNFAGEFIITINGTELQFNANEFREWTNDTRLSDLYWQHPMHDGIPDYSLREYVLNILNIGYNFEEGDYDVNVTLKVHVNNTFGWNTYNSQGSVKVVSPVIEEGNGTKITIFDGTYYVLDWNGFIQVSSDEDCSVVVALDGNPVFESSYYDLKESNGWISPADLGGLLNRTYVMKVTLVGGENDTVINEATASITFVYTEDGIMWTGIRNPLKYDDEDAIVVGFATDLISGNLTVRIDGEQYFIVHITGDSDDLDPDEDGWFYSIPLNKFNPKIVPGVYNLMEILYIGDNGTNGYSSYRNITVATLEPHIDVWDVISLSDDDVAMIYPGNDDSEFRVVILLDNMVYLNATREELGLELKGDDDGEMYYAITPEMLIHKLYLGDSFETIAVYYSSENYNVSNIEDGEFPPFYVEGMLREVEYDYDGPVIAVYCHDTVDEDGDNDDPEYVILKIRVNDGEEKNSTCEYVSNKFVCWNLTDLGLKKGDYAFIEAFFEGDENDPIFGGGLWVVDNSEYRVKSDEVLFVERDAAAVFVFCPEGSEGKTIVLSGFGSTDVEYVISKDDEGNYVTFTLDDLGIGNAGDFDVDVTILDGESSIYQDSIGLRVVPLAEFNSNDVIVLNETDDDKNAGTTVATINLPYGSEGEIIIILDGTDEVFRRNLADMEAEDSDGYLCYTVYMSDLNAEVSEGNHDIGVSFNGYSEVRTVTVAERNVLRSVEADASIEMFSVIVDPSKHDAYFAIVNLPENYFYYVTIDGDLVNEEGVFNVWNETGDEGIKIYIAYNPDSGYLDGGNYIVRVGANNDYNTDLIENMATLTLIAPEIYIQNSDDQGNVSYGLNNDTMIRINPNGDESDFRILVKINDEVYLDATLSELGLAKKYDGEDIYYTVGPANFQKAIEPGNYSDVYVCYSSRYNYVTDNQMIGAKWFEIYSEKMDPDFKISIENAEVGTPIVVTVTARAAFTGVVTVKVNGQDVSVNVVNGSGSNFNTGLTLPIGNYQANLTFEGNDAFNAGNASTTFDVTAIDPNFEIVIDNTVAGNPIVVRVNADQRFTGDVVVQFNTTSPFSIQIHVADGRGTNSTANTENFPMGKYKATLNYEAQGNFSADSAQTTFDVTDLLDPDFNIQIGNVNVGNPIAVTVTANTAFTGDVIVRVKGHEIPVHVNAGEGVNRSTGVILSAGDYSANMTFAGNSVFKGDNASTTFKVLAIDPNFKISIPNVEYGNPIVVTVTANSGFTGVVTVKVAKQFDVLVSVKNGYGTNSTTLILPIDGYIATLNVSASGNFSEGRAQTTFDVTKINPGLVINPISDVVEGNPVTVQVTAKDGFTAPFNVLINNTVVATGNIVNGSGNATISAGNLSVGTVTITVTTDAYGDFTAGTQTAQFNVTKMGSLKIVAKDMSVMYTSGAKYSVTVYGADGALAKNVVVTFKINGKKVATAKTNSKGVATYKTVQKPGTYKITAQALGKSITKKLTVKHVVKLPKVKVKRSAKKLVIKVTLNKVNGKYLKKKKVTLKFKGKKYKAKTNKKGVAKFTIKSKVLKKLKKGKKVTYQATYLKDTVKRTVKVKK